MKITRLIPPLKDEESFYNSLPPWGGGGKIYKSDGTYCQTDDRYWRTQETYYSVDNRKRIIQCRGLEGDEYYLFEGEYETAAEFLTRNGYPLGD